MGVGWHVHIACTKVWLLRRMHSPVGLGLLCDPMTEQRPGSLDGGRGAGSHFDRHLIPFQYVLEKLGSSVADKNVLPRICGHQQARSSIEQEAPFVDKQDRYQSQRRRVASFPNGGRFWPTTDTAAQRNAIVELEPGRLLLSTRLSGRSWYPHLRRTGFREHLHRLR